MTILSGKNGTLRVVGGTMSLLGVPRSKNFPGSGILTATAMMHKIAASVSLSGRGAVTVITEQKFAMTPLTDNFSTQDAGKWSYAGGSASGGQYVCPASANSGLFSVAAYNATANSGQCVVKLVSTPTVGTGGSGTVTEFYIQSTADGTDNEVWNWTNGDLIAREKINGTPDDVTVATSVTGPLWLKITIDNASPPHVTWYTSTDGVSWTQRRTKVSGAIDLTSVHFGCYTGFYGTNPGGNAIWDDFSFSTFYSPTRHLAGSGALTATHVP